MWRILGTGLCSRTLEDRETEVSLLFVINWEGRIIF